MHIDLAVKACYLIYKGHVLLISVNINCVKDIEHVKKAFSDN
jgi:hypothetical protein